MIKTLFFVLLMVSIQSHIAEAATAFKTATDDFWSSLNGHFITNYINLDAESGFDEWPCDKAKLKITSKSDKITIHRDTLNCRPIEVYKEGVGYQLVHQKFKAFTYTFDRVGDGLIYKGKNVGEVSQGSITARITQDPGHHPNAEVVISITRVRDLSNEENWRYSENRYVSEYHYQNSLYFDESMFRDN